VAAIEELLSYHMRFDSVHQATIPKEEVKELNTTLVESTEKELIQHTNPFNRV